MTRIAIKISTSRDLLLQALLQPEMEMRFWSKVFLLSPNQCWPWLGGRAHHGYGNFWCLTNFRSHRVAFFYWNGYFPLNGRHSCDNPPCCNPEHILDGTHKENMYDCIARGRFPVGEKAGLSKLTALQVRSIMVDLRSSRQIAHDYGIGKSSVGAIKRRESYREVVR